MDLFENFCAFHEKDFCPRFILSLLFFLILIGIGIVAVIKRRKLLKNCSPTEKAILLVDPHGKEKEREGEERMSDSDSDSDRGSDTDTDSERESERESESESGKGKEREGEERMSDSDNDS